MENKDFLGSLGKAEAARVRKLVRAAVGRGGTSYQVVEVEGDAPPAFKGEAAYHTTAAGTRVFHPGAYRKKAFARLTRHGSTYRIEVGRDWLEAAARFKEDTHPGIINDYVEDHAHA